jgi:hypothetical protein
MVACAPPEEETKLAVGGNGDDGGEIGETGDGGDDGSLGLAPEITDLRAVFDEYPGVGWVIDIRAAFTDPDGDLDGGILYLRVTEDGEVAVDQEVPIDGTSAYIEGEEVFMALSEVSRESSYVVEVTLIDLAGNHSEPVTATCGG